MNSQTKQGIQIDKWISSFFEESKPKIVYYSGKCKWLLKFFQRIVVSFVKFATTKRANC